jgi:NAD(P)H-hydrate epimerase
MIGAPALTATAALRTGAGLAKLITPEPVLNAALVLTPSATGRGIPTNAAGEIIAHEAAAVIDEVVRGCDALVIGPGLGRGEGPRAATVRAVQNEDVPVIVDADGLNALSETPEFSLEMRSRAIITPHPGEFKRLCEAMGLKTHLGLATSRESACEQLAQRLGCVVVLKGAGTVVSNGAETWTHDVQDAVLATGGTGDVLAGIIAGLVSQFMESGPMASLPAQLVAKARAAGSAMHTAKSLSLFDAARLGVVLHTTAATLWREAHANASGGMLAMELAHSVPEAMQRLRQA